MACVNADEIFGFAAMGVDSRWFDRIVSRGIRGGGGGSGGWRSGTDLCLFLLANGYLLECLSNVSDDVS